MKNSKIIKIYIISSLLVSINLSASQVFDDLSFEEKKETYLQLINEKLLNLEVLKKCIINSETLIDSRKCGITKKVDSIETIPKKVHGLFCYLKSNTI